MSVQTNNQSARAAHRPWVQEAALIANFYGKRGQLHSLRDDLVRGLDLLPLGQHDYANATTKTFLRHFELPAASAHDTTVVQLALNMPGAVEAAWRAMREQLEAVLPDDSALTAVWGYTLIYQAELAQDVPPATVLAELLPAARRLHSPVSEQPQTLAQTDMPGGLVGLIDLPLQGDGLNAATVYIALSQPDSNNRLVRDVLYNPAAALLMADLTAHKGYHQMRQYRLGGLDVQYRHNMKTLSSHTDILLDNLTRATVTAGELDDLASGSVAKCCGIKQLSCNSERNECVVGEHSTL